MSKQVVWVTGNPQDRKSRPWGPWIGWRKQLESGQGVWALAVSETHSLTTRSGYVQALGLIKVWAHSFFQPKFIEHLLHTVLF